MYHHEKENGKIGTAPPGWAVLHAGCGWFFFFFFFLWVDRLMVTNHCPDNLNRLYFSPEF